MLLYVLDAVWGVTQLHGVVYVVCRMSSTIRRFDATTHRRLADISIKGLRAAYDIAGCHQTSRLYVADMDQRVWRVSADGADIKHWLPTSPSDVLRPRKLSVTSTRLLVTSRLNQQLIQFDAGGRELRRVRLQDMEPLHAVESPTGTFIVCLSNTRLKHWQVSEVDAEGHVLRQFSGSRLLPLGWTPRIAIDSQGNVFAADSGNCRILLLDAQLALRRVIIDEHQLNCKPQRLCYKEQSGQLLVGLDLGGVVSVFDVLRP